MESILERIAKSLETIAEEFKARRVNQLEALARIEEMEVFLKDFAENPFGRMKAPKRKE